MRFAGLVAILGVCIATAITPTASAAEASVAETQTAPVLRPVGTIGVQWWMEAEPDEAIAIISTQIDDSVELPVRVRLPIPPGMTVNWAGEVSGGDVAQDIAREFVVAEGEGGSYAEFEVSQYRAAQIDLSGKPLATGSGRVAIDLEFVQSVASSETAFTVRLPAGASDVEISPAPDGAPTTNDVGESLYSLPISSLDAGASQVTHVEYTQSSSEGLPPVGGGLSQGDRVVAVLVALVAVVGIGLAIILRRQARQRDH